MCTDTGHYQMGWGEYRRTARFPSDPAQVRRCGILVKEICSSDRESLKAFFGRKNGSAGATPLPGIQAMGLHCRILLSMNLCYQLFWGLRGSQILALCQSFPQFLQQ